MTSRQHSRTGPEGEAGAPKGAVCYEASPVFGYLAAPDGNADTVDQEVLSLFEEPPARPIAPARPAAPERPAAPHPYLPEPEPEHAPVPDLGLVPSRPPVAGPQDARRRARRRTLTWIAVCAVAACAASAAVLYGLVGPRDADRLVTLDSPRPKAPATLPAIESSVAPAPVPTPTASVSASATPTPTTTPSATPSQTPSATPSEAAREPSASPSPTPPPEPPAREPAAPRTLSVGSTGPEVADLQRRLDQVRVFHGAYDGVFDDDLADAVHRFQWIRGVEEEAGVYGPATRAALVAETSGAGERDRHYS
ncbi:peptidoglycan-binding domain-containing protein [Streptomyces californicus]|uniref:peptidoglycan-binding domain-containing protein n=1 Tax=Streptomyces californicus TaxID=67351 RepID=UPI00296FEE29|nr:peptidoglycan-binding domain-containing protein [Streptomyces californicus]MDW4911895.1 peptidoglycan-binding domain-containing protein [Streptomyces californicus]